MSDWTSGYVAEIGYRHSYFHELNPLSLTLPFLAKGLVPPRIETACELGFGQGLSINIHAAASKVAWWGTDFNPSQTGFAMELARASGNGATLYDEAFLEFCNRVDLPNFDFIGIHGTWSWLSDENRKVIVDFLRRKLAVGGVLYMSYNTLPGWTAFSPMRHLMTEHASTVSGSGQGIVRRIDDAIDFAERLLNTQPIFSQENPAIADRLSKMKLLGKDYLAHEYFNRDWHPMFFSTIAEWLGEAKLSYACSANFIDHIDAVNLTEGQRELMSEIHDTPLRETIRDFMVNQQFRRDYWVKGPRPICDAAREVALENTQVMFATHRPTMDLTVNGALGEASLNSEVYAPILEVMSDNKPKSVSEVIRLVASSGVSSSQAVEAVSVLVGQRIMAVVEHDANRQRVSRLNAHLRNLATDSEDINFLASPLTGGGVFVSRLQLMFLTAQANHQQSPEDWAEWVWTQLKSQGHVLYKDGKAIETEEDSLAHLTEEAENFSLQALPVLKALEVC